MKINTLMLALLLAGLSVPALAEEPPPPHAGRPGGLAIKVNTVKNAPYSAQVVTERQQTLGDGNQITEQRSSIVTYRDSAGRTRREILGPKGEVRLVTINDPVAGVNWVLRPQHHSATKMERPPRGGARTGEEVILKRVERTGPEARQHTEEDVRIQVSKALAENGGGLRDMRARFAPLASAFGDVKWSAKAVTKELGTREFNGVKAEGKLRSYEIPAGEIGNRNPIVVSDESWYAPDLQVTVYTKHSDPRSGDAVFRLENLKREEPAASLFSVPSDYTVKEPPARTKSETRAQ
jgi:hypothetical protein